MSFWTHNGRSRELRVNKQTRLNIEHSTIYPLRMFHCNLVLIHSSYHYKISSSKANSIDSSPISLYWTELDLAPNIDIWQWRKLANHKGLVIAILAFNVLSWHLIAKGTVSKKLRKFQINRLYITAEIPKRISSVKIKRFCHLLYFKCRLEE